MNPSPVSDIPSPHPEIAYPSSSPSFESLNHTSTLASLVSGERTFFFAYMAISFCVIVIFLFFVRKHLYGLLYDSRTLVSDLELPVRKQKYGVLDSGESKEYGNFAQLDELDELDKHLEEKERKVDQGICV